MERLTPPGMAGVAVYRFAAHERHLVAARVRAGSSLEDASLRPVRGCLLLDDLVEDALFVGRSDGSLEVHTHGSFAVDALLAARFGAPIPRTTSPSQRLLREAMGDEQVALALEQDAHDFTTEVARLAAMPVAARSQLLLAAMERSRVVMAHAHPCAVHLVGRQNAGKSTVFNRLLGRERSLAGDVAGLTRDAVTESLVLAGYPYRLFDHAGEGEVDDPVDVDAIRRSRSASVTGIRMLLVDASDGPDATDRRLASSADLVLATKSDLPAAPWPIDVACHGRCSATSASAAGLQAQFGGLLRRLRGLPAAGPVGGFAACDAAQLCVLESLAQAGS